jgi:polysaccharide biosynthesis/export protein
MRHLLLISTGLLVLPLAHAQSHTKQAPPAASEPKTKTDSASRTSNPSVPVVPDDYKIGPQDVVRIDVWKEPEITRTIPVRPDGKISLPLLNDVQAAGLTAMQLAGNIREALTKYIANPQVTVTVTEINSRRVFVTGEVGRSGALPLLPNMTVLQALSSAGGFSQFARPTKIYVLRVEDGKQVKHPFNYKKVVKGDYPEENILLQNGDVIVVP